MAEGSHIKGGPTAMRGDIEWIPDPTAIPKIATSKPMEEILFILAVKIKETAQVIAAERAFDTGEYSRGIQANVDISGNTAIGHVVATDYKSVWIEFGTGPRPQAGFTVFEERAVLRSAMDAIGATTVFGESDALRDYG